MKHSEEVNEVLAALAKFQADDPRPKNTETANLRQYSYSYSPLSEIISVIRPALSKQGLGFAQEVKLVEEGRAAAVSTIIFHKSGQWLEFAPVEIKVDYTNKSVNAAQAAGIAMTYGRRYSLSAALGVSSEDDTDGTTGAEGREDRSKTIKNSQNNQQPTLKQRRTAEIFKIAKDNSIKLDNKDMDFIKQEIEAMGRDKIEELNQDEFQDIIALFKQRLLASKPKGA